MRLLVQLAWQAFFESAASKQSPETTSTKPRALQTLRNTNPTRNEIDFTKF